MEYHLLSDELLLKLLRVEDEGAFQEIYKRYFRILSASAMRKVKSVEDVEEIMQEIFMSLWEKRLTLSISNLKAYLYGALKYQIIDFYKHQFLSEKHTDFSINDELLNENSTEIEINLQQIYTIFESAIQALPEKTSKIFSMNRVENKTIREISQTLSIPERTVEYHITQALKKLRLQLKDYLPLIIFYSQV